jgi:hypothetical protein
MVVTGLVVAVGALNPVHGHTTRWDYHMWRVRNFSGPIIFLVAVQMPQDLKGWKRRPTQVIIARSVNIPD